MQSEYSKLSTVPDSLKKLRACLTCKLIKSERQFSEGGCENCDTSIELSGDLQNYTTSNFAGMICMMDPEHSWVARWQKLISLYPGVYAIDVKAEY